MPAIFPGFCSTLLNGWLDDPNCLMNFLTNSSGDLRTGFRVLVFAALSFLVLLIVQTVVSMTGLAAGLPFQAAVYPLEAVGVLAVSVLCFRGLDHASINELGLRQRKAMWHGLAGFTAGALTIDLIFLGLVWRAGFKSLISLHFEVFASKDFMLWVAMFFFAATLEELLFRGYPFLTLQRVVHRWGAAALLSILFVAFHPNFYPYPAAWLSIFLAGFFLTQLFVWSGSLWLPIGFHFGWNVAQALIFPLPGLQPTLVRVARFNPSAVGINIGVEQSWWAAALLLVLIALGEEVLLELPRNFRSASGAP
jgi:membrane protease YdiL (CAAX protease family)